VACGDQITLNEMISTLQKISKKDIKALYGPVREGDIPHSKASIEKIQSTLNYHPKYRFEKGLEIVYDWYLNNKLD
jgi:UDP-N-acetylglucosamine 4-epimerase